MNRKLYIRLAILSLVAVVGASSCVNPDYNIDSKKIDTGVQVAPNGFSIPLGYLERKTLGQIIDNDMLVADDETGFYFLRHGDVISHTVPAFNVPSIDEIMEMYDPVTISPTDGEPAPTQVSLPENNTTVPMDIPSFDFSGDTKIQPLSLSGEGSFPITGSVVGGITYDGDVSSTDGKIDIDFNLPEEVAKIETVWLGPQDDGTKVDVTFMLGELANISQNIKINSLQIVLPPRYVLAKGPLGGVVIDGYGGGTANRLTLSNHDMGNSVSFSFSFFIESLSLGDKTPGNVTNPDGPDYYGLKFQEDFSYSLDYTLLTKAGTVNAAGTQPSVSISGQPAFKDAAFVTGNIDFSLDEPYVSKLDYKIGKFPSTVEKVNYITFDDTQNTVTVTIDDLGLPFVKTENDPVIEVTFPSVFQLTDPNTPSLLSGNVLKAPLSKFVPGYNLRLNKVTFGPDEGIPVGGYIDFSKYNHSIVVDVNHQFTPESFLWSDNIAGLNPPSEIDVAVAAATLKIDDSAGASEMLIAEVAKPVDGSQKISEKFDLPEEVKRIDKVYIKEVAESTEVIMTLSANIKNPLLDEFYLDDFTVGMPAFLMIDGDQFGTGVEFDEETNTYFQQRKVISRPGASNDFDITIAEIAVKGFKDVDIEETINGMIGMIEGDVTYSAIARSPEGADVDPFAPDMVITPKLKVTGIKVTALEGMFDIKIEDYIGAIEPISLEEIFDVIGDSDQNPRLAPPVVKVEISNPFGINLLGNIDLDPKDKEGESLAQVDIPELKIDPADGPTAKDTKIYIIDDEATDPADSEGFKIIRTNIADLMSVIPHTIDIGVKGNVNPAAGLINSLQIGQSYDIKLDYSVEVPLAFASDMKLDMEFTVDELNSTFSSLAKQKVKASDITAYAEMTVSFPLKLSNIKVKFTDKDGEEIEGLKTTVGGEISGPSGTGAPHKSQLTIKLEVPNGGDFTTLEKIDKMNIKVPITGSKEGEGYNNALNANDYIEGKIWLELAKGLSINIGDLMGDDK